MAAPVASTLYTPADAAKFNREFHRLHGLVRTVPSTLEKKVKHLDVTKVSTASRVPMHGGGDASHPLGVSLFVLPTTGSSVERDKKHGEATAAASKVDDDFSKSLAKLSLDPVQAVAVASILQKLANLSPEEEAISADFKTSLELKRSNDDVVTQWQTAAETARQEREERVAAAVAAGGGAAAGGAAAGGAAAGSGPGATYKCFTSTSPHDGIPDLMYFFDRLIVGNVEHWMLVPAAEMDLNALNTVATCSNVTANWTSCQMAASAEPSGLTCLDPFLLYVISVLQQIIDCEEEGNEDVSGSDRYECYLYMKFLAAQSPIHGNVASLVALDGGHFARLLALACQVAMDNAGMDIPPLLLQLYGTLQPSYDLDPIGRDIMVVAESLQKRETVVSVRPTASSSSGSILWDKTEMAPWYLRKEAFKEYCQCSRKEERQALLHREKSAGPHEAATAECKKLAQVFESPCLSVGVAAGSVLITLHNALYSPSEFTNCVLNDDELSAAFVQFMVDNFCETTAPTHHIPSSPPAPLAWTMTTVGQTLTATDAMIGSHCRRLFCTPFKIRQVADKQMMDVVKQFKTSVNKMRPQLWRNYEFRYHLRFASSGESIDLAHCLRTETFSVGHNVDMIGEAIARDSNVATYAQGEIKVSSPTAMIISRTRYRAIHMQIVACAFALLRRMECSPMTMRTVEVGL